MVNRNLIRGIDAGIENWEAEIQTAMGDQSTEELFAPGDELDVNQIVTGNILRVDSEFVLVDVGYKSEGIIPRSEWEDDDEEPTCAKPNTEGAEPTLAKLRRDDAEPTCTNPNTDDAEPERP